MATKPELTLEKLAGCLECSDCSDCKGTGRRSVRIRTGSIVVGGHTPSEKVEVTCKTCCGSGVPLIGNDRALIAFLASEIIKLRGGA